MYFAYSYCTNSWAKFFARKNRNWLETGSYPLRKCTYKSRETDILAISGHNENTSSIRLRKNCVISTWFVRKKNPDSFSIKLCISQRIIQRFDPPIQDVFSGKRIFYILFVYTEYVDNKRLPYTCMISCEPASQIVMTISMGKIETQLVRKYSLLEHCKPCKGLHNIPIFHAFNWCYEEVKYCYQNILLTYQ